MMMDTTYKSITERCGTTLGIFSGKVIELNDVVAWVVLHCGAQPAWVPIHMAQGFQLGEEVTLRCWQTDHGICAKPLEAPIREGHLWHRQRRAA
jgi:hypothetical protein